MRILLTHQPLTGHFHAMVPLAIALRDAGHEVAFATGARFGKVVERAGFRVFACGIDYVDAPMTLESIADWPECCARFPGKLALQQVCGFVEGFAPAMAEDLLPLVAEWRPHVIVREPLEFGGYLAAETYGLPCASVMWGIYISVPEVVPDSLHALRARFNLPPDPALVSVDRDLVLKFLPMSWTNHASAEPASLRAFCAPPWDHPGESELPEWFARLPDQPTVYATLGTTFNRAPEVFQTLMEALADEPINVVITIGRTNDPESLPPPPNNVTIAQYIPQTLILPHCEAIIFHGGYNSLLSGLWNGLPMVVIPMGGGDQWPTAQICAAQGVGIHVDESPLTAAAVRQAVRAVLHEPGYRARAQEVRAEILRLPPLSEAVRLLEVLAAA